MIRFADRRKPSPCFRDVYLLLYFNPTPDPSGAFTGPMMRVLGPKGPERFGASLKKKEDTMKLVSRFEAASLGIAALHGLLAEAQRAFAAAPRGSQERRDALESIRHIECELAIRAPSP